MYLLVCATELEMRPFRELVGGMRGADYLITGVGLVETTLALSKYLGAGLSGISNVINFGIAGAYMDSGAGLLDICVARKEVLGDLGICFHDHLEPFDESILPVRTRFDLNTQLLSRAVKILDQNGIRFRKGTFVTVNSATGTTGRGEYLRNTHHALCENMEGAAVARVCLEYSIPCLEIRCISNMVEDRDTSKWQLTEACRTCAETVSKLLTDLNSA